MTKTLLILAFILLASSCRKDDDPEIQPMLKARIDGYSLTSTETSRLLVNNQLQLSGADDHSRSVTITIQVYKGTGFYYFVPADGNKAVYKYGNRSYESVKGLVKVTRDDAKALQGTFYFETDSTAGIHRIENGSFSFGK